MKRIFLIAAALILCCLAGCKNEQNAVNSAAENIIEPPENGWTVEQLNEVLYLNGQQIQMPLMLSTLKGGYEIKEKEYYENDESGSGLLYCNDDFIAIVSFYEIDGDCKITTLNFPPSYYENEQDYTNYCRINGFGLKDNISNIQNYLGGNFVKDSSFYVYVVGNDEYTILVADAEENHMIMIFEGVNAEND